MNKKFDGYIPTPLRRRLGLPAPAIITFSNNLGDFIDASAGAGHCWPWIGRRDRDGYGVVTRKGRSNRLVW